MKKDISAHTRHYESLPLACGICLSSNNLVRDHDHCTGRCRGWLCKRCNHLVGILENVCQSKYKPDELRGVYSMIEAVLRYIDYWGKGVKFRSLMTPTFPNHQGSYTRWSDNGDREKAALEEGKQGIGFYADCHSAHLADWPPSKDCTLRLCTHSWHDRPEIVTKAEWHIESMTRGIKFTDT